MTQESSDPDLNLQLLNDHGIYTIEEINELSRTVKPQFSAIHLNSRSLKQHFDEICNLLDSISCLILSLVPRHGLLLKLIILVFKFFQSIKASFLIVRNLQKLLQFSNKALVSYVIITDLSQFYLP